MTSTLIVCRLRASPDFFLQATSIHMCFVLSRRVSSGHGGQESYKQLCTVFRDFCLAQEDELHYDAATFKPSAESWRIRGTDPCGKSMRGAMCGAQCLLDSPDNAWIAPELIHILLRSPLVLMGDFCPANTLSCQYCLEQILFLSSTFQSNDPPCESLRFGKADKYLAESMTFLQMTCHSQTSRTSCLENNMAFSSDHLSSS